MMVLTTAGLAELMAECGMSYERSMLEMESSMAHHHTIRLEVPGIAIPYYFVYNDEAQGVGAIWRHVGEKDALRYEARWYGT